MTALAEISYFILSLPFIAGMLYIFWTYISSPFVVFFNILEELVPKQEEKLDLSRTRQSLVEQLFLGSTGKLPTKEEYQMFSGLSKSEIYELFKKLSSDSTLDYDPRYAIDDPLQFAD
jgi:hypothetical protein